MSITINTLGKDQIPSIKEFYLAALEEEIHFSAANSFRSVDYSSDSKARIHVFFENAYMNDHFGIFLLYVHQTLLGFIMLSYQDALAEQPTQIGYINGIYIHPGHRKKGYGHLLMKRALEWFKDHDLEVIELNMTIGNKTVEHFWSKYGFKPLETVCFLKIGCP